MVATGADGFTTLPGTQLQVRRSFGPSFLRRWRYFDPMLGEQVECSHLMDAAEALALTAFDALELALPIHCCPWVGHFSIERPVHIGGGHSLKR